MRRTESPASGQRKKLITQKTPNTTPHHWTWVDGRWVRKHRTPAPPSSVPDWYRLFGYDSTPKTAKKPPPTTPYRPLLVWHGGKKWVNLHLLSTTKTATSVIRTTTPKKSPPYVASTTSSAGTTTTTTTTTTATSTTTPIILPQVTLKNILFYINIFLKKYY